ncbi:MAG: threonine aldolase [Gammaproteobacteria bacterium]|nr:threonine aldolase [Gammaproteobacteria bacterium]
MTSLSGHPPRTQRQWFAWLAEHAADRPLDVYGQGAEVQAFEAEVAALLGKPAAVFVPKGVIAQQAALRVWCDRRRVAAVAVHPRCHLVEDEDLALQHLHRLRLLPVGAGDQPFSAADLDAVHEALGAVAVELPLRRAGFKLSNWNQLQAISAWARGRALPLHFDGARLWESQPHYGRPLAEIAALADSLYVSFYKGLGGLGGGALAGAETFIAAVRPWLTRHGAYPYAIAPYVVAAGAGLTRHLPKMSGYVARARRLATAIGRIEGLRVIPDPPHTNGFQVRFPAATTLLEPRLREVESRTGVQLFPWLRPAADGCFGEVQIGEAAETLGDDQVLAALRRLVAPPPA